MAERLLARGDKVIATLRKPARWDDLCEQYNGRLHDPAGRYGYADAVRRTGAAGILTPPGVSMMLVSTAGYGLFGAAEEASDAQIDRQDCHQSHRPDSAYSGRVTRSASAGGGRIVQISLSSEGGDCPPRISAFITLPNGDWDLLNRRP